jgi:hypothetical protein
MPLKEFFFMVLGVNLGLHAWLAGALSLGNILSPITFSRIRLSGFWSFIVLD